MFLRLSKVGLAAYLVSANVLALPNGIETNACNGCHTADVAYDGNISLEPNAELLPGVEASFTLRIEESHMKEAGFFVYSGGVGTFEAGTGTRASSTGVVHNKPAPAVDGVVEINFSWTPPAQADGLDMLVYVVAADDSSSQAGDIPASASFPLVWGCEGMTLYEDIDADGYGNANGPQSIGCGKRDGWSTTGDDCNDLWVSIHPGAKEVANNKDDDCNGEIDDGVVIGTWYRDRDGDGYGEVGTDVVGETGPTGYVGNSDDCDDFDPSISPEGVEVCDGIDNDCNRELDEGEGVYVVCGVGVCSRRWETCDTECRPGTPMLEACNGLDDDCDGTVDEDVTCPDGSACERGTCPTAPIGSGPDVAASAPASTATSGSTASATTVGTQESTLDSNVTGTSRVDSLDAGSSSVAPSRNDDDYEDSATSGHSQEGEGSAPRSSGCGLTPSQSSNWSCLTAMLGGVAWRSRRRAARSRRRAR